MPYVDAADVEESRVAPPFERVLKMVMEDQEFTLIYSELAPRGGGTDFHVHESSGELMVFIGGTGKAWLAGEEHQISPGDAMYAPRGVEHKTLNTGTEPLKIVCVFVPPVSADYIRNAK